MSSLSKLVVATSLVVTAASSAAVLLAPPSPQEREIRRQARAERLLRALSEGIWSYYGERGSFPPGDGIGSASLVRALSQNSRLGVPFMSFADGMLTSTGDLRNPAAPDARILFYRNNREGAGSDAKVHNIMNFDLWAAGSDGVFDSVNNWTPTVSTP